MRSATLHLSWPPAPLWQNRPAHWAKAMRAKRAYKHEAWAKALEAGVQHLGTTTPRLSFHFRLPDRRKRDLQNMPATQKAAIDGIAKAMGCDDAGFRCVWPEEWAPVTAGGAVIVIVAAESDWQHIGDVARGMVKGAVC